MGLIKFKYIVNSSLKPLIMNTFADIATPDSLVDMWMRASLPIWIL